MPGRTTEPLLYQEPAAGPRGHRKTSQRSGGRARSRFDSDYNDGVLDNVWAGGNRRLLKLTLMAMCLGITLYVGINFSYVAKSGRAPATSCDTIDHGYQCYPKIAQSWGQYSPFYSVPSELSSADTTPATPLSPLALPPTCKYTFAQVLSRHGGRDPTASKSAAYAALMDRILDTSEHFSDGPDGRFGFLNEYSYRMGADELTRFGELQMVHSGAHFYRRYRSLLNSLATPTTHADPFVRSADQHRVLLSAINWVQGFQGARHTEQQRQQDSQEKSRKGKKPLPPSEHKDGESGQQHIILLPEESGFNNTLSYNGLCKKFTSRRGSAAQRTFAETFVPAITARLNRGLQGANLTDTDTINLMDMCPYETIADEHDRSDSNPSSSAVSGGRRLSPFCHLFSEAEWHGYDYYQTLGKWYGFGDGSTLGATQGVGFVNELIARLTQSPVDDHTSTNRTMDADPVTFPLNATVYADFSHDNDMSNIFAALGLYAGATGEAPLDPSNTTRVEPGDMRGFAAGWTVPFAARMYVEKMVCGGDEEELVRVLVNDRVIPLQNCGADVLGRCRLSKFIDSLAFARKGGNWEDCFA
ncbi:phytase [Ophiostoma piceae UAMH 11346]|uniref:3-phytase n=1 Tax=Ophiostoma piceae (strain UAMH 11346) TaxID=1262450 RepID=S3CRM7_OPHP1|nr:phytase [Ophiostoma piceae UAMH 11346]